VLLVKCAGKGHRHNVAMMRVLGARTANPFDQFENKRPAAWAKAGYCHGSCCDSRGRSQGQTNRELTGATGGPEQMFEPV
jgi:hypothetical protein